MKHKGRNWSSVASSQGMMEATRAGRGKKVSSPRGFGRNMSLLTHQNNEKINFCYFKPPSLCFVMAALTVMGTDAIPIITGPV